MAFPLQITVLMAYVQKEYMQPRFISERGPHTGKNVFYECSLSKGHITPQQAGWYEKIHDEISWTPDVMIYIKANPETCLQRVRQRGREGEEAVTLAYLKELHSKHSEMLKTLGHRGVNCFTVDGNVSSELVVQQVKMILLDVLSGSLA